MLDILGSLLTLILNYGYPIIFVTILIGYMGVPISLNAILLASGAFAVDGTLNIYILIPYVAFCALLGDLFNYYLGKKFGYLLINRFTKKVGLTEKRLSFVDGYMDRWGDWSIFYTRWLFTPIGIPVNIIAGMRKYSVKNFVLFAGCGELIWAGMYISLGYFFGANWYVLWEYIQETPQIIMLLGLGFGLLYMTYRIWKHYR